MELLDSIEQDIESAPLGAFVRSFVIEANCEAGLRFEALLEKIQNRMSLETKQMLQAKNSPLTPPLPNRVATPNNIYIDDFSKYLRTPKTE